MFCLCSLFGFVLGIVLVGVAGSSWWAGNRIAYAQNLLNGGFGLAIIFLLHHAIVAIAVLVCSMCKAIHPLLGVVCFAYCLYCGAVVGALFTLSVLFATLYVLLVCVWQICAITICCFAAHCDCNVDRKLSEALADQKQAYATICLAWVVKIFMFFVILRLLMALI